MNMMGLFLPPLSHGVELSRLEVEACAKREARESGSCGAEVHDMLEDRKGRWACAEMRADGRT